MVNRIAPLSCGLLATVALVGLLAQGAAAQMFEKPYNSPSRDRAGLAIVMKQVDSGMFGRSVSSTGTSAGGVSQVLLCGGPDGGSTATSNSSCIILGDGATGMINLGQDSAGNQDAQATQNQTTNNNADLSDALSGLTP